MSQQIAKNTFEGGLNQDITKENLKANQYFEGVGVTLTSDSDFTAVKVRKGDSVIASIPGTAAVILNAYEAVFTYSNSFDTFGNPVKVPCIVLFFYNEGFNGDRIEIYLYIKDSSQLVLIGAYGWNYSVTTSRRLYIDAVRFTENGEDSLYFVDGVTEPKKLKLNSKTITNI